MRLSQKHLWITALLLSGCTKHAMENKIPERYQPFAQTGKVHPNIAEPTHGHYKGGDTYLIALEDLQADGGLPGSRILRATLMPGAGEVEAVLTLSEGVKLDDGEAKQRVTLGHDPVQLFFTVYVKTPGTNALLTIHGGDPKQPQHGQASVTFGDPNHIAAPQSKTLKVIPRTTSK